MKLLRASLLIALANVSVICQSQIVPQSKPIIFETYFSKILKVHVPIPKGWALQDFSDSPADLYDIFITPYGVSPTNAHENFLHSQFGGIHISKYRLRAIDASRGSSLKSFLVFRQTYIEKRMELENLSSWMHYREGGYEIYKSEDIGQQRSGGIDVYAFNLTLPSGYEVHAVASTNSKEDQTLIIREVVNGIQFQFD